MTYEAAAALDVRGLAGRFADTLQAAGFDFERPSLAAALQAYEEWLRKPVRGLEWGESDYAVVGMEPDIANGTYAIDLGRYLGELGNESSIALKLAFAVDEVPGLRGLWGTTAEALDEAPAVWIARELRNEPAIAAALADDRPAAADLWIDASRVP
jgi:hypothetical protein